MEHRSYGKGPYRSIVLHGGPGAPGEMEPVCREISEYRGVIEPFSLGLTLDEQLSELKELIEEAADPPVVLIGFSFGAMLGLLFTADHPELVEKLILVGSGPVEERYVSGLTEERLERLSQDERDEIPGLMYLIDMGDEDAFSRFGDLMTRANAFDQISGEGAEIEHHLDVFRGVWSDMEELRKRGGLIRAAARIRCPVAAIHGDSDPHPAEGVRALSGVVKNFKFILLERCGHRPWIERHAKEDLYMQLRSLIEG